MDIIKLIFNLLLSSLVVCAFLLIKYAGKRRNMPGAGYFILLLLAAVSVILPIRRKSMHQRCQGH